MKYKSKYSKTSKDMKHCKNSFLKSIMDKEAMNETLFAKIDKSF
jgi:hypothetical protein